MENLKPLKVYTSSDGFSCLYEEGTEVWDEERTGLALAGPRTVVARDLDNRYASLLTAAFAMHQALKFYMPLIKLLLPEVDTILGDSALAQAERKQS